MPTSCAAGCRRYLGAHGYLLISRDGNIIHVTAQLCDRALLQQQAWSQHFIVPSSRPRRWAKLPRKRPLGRRVLRDDMIPRALYVGAMGTPVRTQLADYFGVKSGTGLLVESME